MDLRNAINYQDPNFPLQDKLIAGVFWDHWCMGSIAKTANWNVEEGCDKSVGTRHHFVRGIGMNATPGDGAVNGAPARLRLDLDRGFVERCQAYKAILKIDNETYRKYCNQNYDIDAAVKEGITRWIHEQVETFNVTKIAAMALPCNIIGSPAAPILIDEEYNPNIPPKVADAVRPSHVISRLLKKLQKTDLLCNVKNLHVLAPTDFDNATFNENSCVNMKCDLSNGTTLEGRQFKGTSIMLDTSNYVCPAGEFNGKPYYYIVMYDGGEVWAPHDLLTMKWHEEAFHRNLAIEGTFGFGVRRAKSIAVAVVQFV